MINSSYAAQRAFSTFPEENQVTSSRRVRSVDDWHPVDRARHTFLTRADDEFYDDTLSAEGRKLAHAAVAPGKVGAPGVQVSTFAVDGVQSSNIVLIKRVPETANGPNFVLYVPEKEGQSFHEFDTREAMSDWLKDVARDPAELDKFAAHFDHPATPGVVNRVKNTLARFAGNQVGAIVGSWRYERGDIFTRLDKDLSVPPVLVPGVTQARLYKLEHDGTPSYTGYLPDGTTILYKYDAYGNLHGASGKNKLYFVRNGLNVSTPLVPMTLKEYTQKVAAVSMDNVGANDLAGIFHEFIKQLRNPGEGLSTALIEFGVRPDVAYSIEEIFKNPVKGTLLQLNHDNRLGRLFGVSKTAMDAWLEKVGGELQSRIPEYGKARERLDALADILEKYGPPAPDTETKVKAR